MRKHTPLRRRPLTKAQLLPLPTDQVRRISLKRHLALATLCSGYGGAESIATLSNALELALYLGADSESEPYRCADTALNQCIARAGRGDPWALTEAERTSLESFLLAHDEQLEAVPVHRYLEALETVHRVGMSDVGLPIETD